MSQYDYAGLGFRIAQKRKAKGLTQAEFAELLGISAQAVSKWETGGGYPDISSLPEIATVLELSIDELFGLKKEKPESPGERSPGLPEKIDDMYWVASYGDYACYASKAECELDLPKIRFKDGSTADLSSRVIMNLGQNIVIVEKDRYLKDFEAAQARASQEESGSDEERVEEGQNPEKIKEAEGREEIIQSAKEEDERRDKLDFKSLRLEFLASSIDFRVIHDPTMNYGWYFDGPENIRELIKSEIINNELMIRLERQSRWSGLNFFINSKHSTEGEILINCPYPRMEFFDLNLSAASDGNIELPFAAGKIDIKGSGDCQLMEIEHLKARVFGSGDITVNKIKDLDLLIAGVGDVEIKEASESIKAVISGVGDMNLAGDVKSCELQISGVGDVNARELSCDELNCIVSGPGSAVIGRVRGASKERAIIGSLKILKRGYEA
ncbi:MAG: DUF2807 domain-containing protein [Eubacteriales bacterium]|nr:DUF2807 domain-containing protein [Eubacteriales bacterium]